MPQSWPAVDGWADILAAEKQRLLPLANLGGGGSSGDGGGGSGRASTSGGSSSDRVAWHPAVIAQAAGARLLLPDGCLVDRLAVSPKAEICLDRLAVLYGGLRAAYAHGYAFRRTPLPDGSGHSKNEFCLPGSRAWLTPGPFIRHIKELEAGAPKPTPAPRADGA